MTSQSSCGDQTRRGSRDDRDSKGQRCADDNEQGDQPSSQAPDAMRLSNERQQPFGIGSGVPALRKPGRNTVAIKIRYDRLLNVRLFSDAGIRTGKPLLLKVA